MDKRFEMIRPLGLGGRGSVYLVRDHGRKGMRAALKRLKNAQNLRRAAAEFERLSRLRHPNLARAYDLGEDDEGVYFTSEFVDGLPLRQWADAATPQETVRALGGLLRALSLLHDRALVHGDISFGNVMVSCVRRDSEQKGCRVKLLDLGEAGPPGHTGGGMTAGFAAPEILTGRGALITSDLYAFGALTAELLLGAKPFGSGEASEIVQRQLSGELQLPKSDVSPIAALCRELLRTEPAERPQSAAEVLRRLSEATEVDLAFDLTALNADDLPAPRLIARERETAALYAFIEQMEDPAAGRIALIEGPPGSGRSAVLQEAALFARLAGIDVLGTGCTRGDESHLLSELCASCDPTSLSAPARRALAPWRAGERDPAHKTTEISNVVFAALEALALTTQQAPKLIVVDDWSAADSVTQKTVLAFARSLSSDRPGRPRAAVILAAQQRETAALESMFPAIVSLQPLDRTGIARLAASMLPGITVPPAFCDALFIASSGLPKSAVELVRQSAGSDFALPSEVTEAKLRKLSDSEQRAVAALGVIDAPVSQQLLSALELEESSVTALLRQGILTADETRLSAVYTAAKTTAEAARRTVDKAAFRTFAQSAAAALMEKGSFLEAGSLYRSVGNRKEAHAAFFAAAKERQIQGDLLGAAEQLERAISEWDNTFDISETARTAVEIWRTVGRFEQAQDILAAAAYSPEKARLTTAELTMDQGRHSEAAALLAEVTPTPKNRLRIAALSAACSLQLGAHEPALSTITEALSKSGENPALEAQLAQIGGVCCTYLGRMDRAEELLRQAEKTFQSEGDALGRLKVLGNMGMLHRRRGDLAESRRLYDEAVASAIELGDRPREGLHRMNRATVAQAACNYDDAYRDYLAAGEIAEILGNDFRAAQVEVNLADLLVDMGQGASAQKIAGRALRRCRGLSQERLETRALLTAGRASLSVGDLFRAEQRLLEALRRFCAAGDESGRVFAQIRIAELWLERRDFSRAETEALSAEKATRKKGRYRENARALVAAARAAMEMETDVGAERALDRLTQAEDALRREPAPDTLMQTSLLRARLSAKRGRSEEGRAALDRARALFQGIFEKVPDNFKEEFLAGLAAPELVRAEETAPSEPCERWARDLEMLMEINRELTSERDPKRLLGLIMESAVNLTGAERGMLVMPKGGTLEPVISHQIAEQADRSFSRSVAEKVVREGRAILTVDALGDERFRAFVSVNALKLRSILAVPLKIKRRVVGAVYLDSRLQTGVFSDADRRLLEAFGAQAAVCLETARLISENQDRCRALQEANEEIQKLSSRLEEKLEKNEAKLVRVGALLEKTQAKESDKLKRGGMVGASPAMQQVRKLISRIAPANVPVYIFGASGTGKELAARAIHSESERHAKPFVAVNCGALPSKLLAGELFGHKKGAFTGAVSDRPGLFKVADKGTLFLDEVSDMDKEMQTHLLRVLQDGTFRSLGDNEEVSVDVRILAASNRDLEEEVKAGRFREDLFYRLNVVRIDLPPLTDRREDISLLIDAFAARINPKNPPRFTRAAVDLLSAANWPGNVRELENEVLRSVTMAADAAAVAPSDLSPRFTANLKSESWTETGGLKEQTAVFEEMVIRRKMADCGGNASKAARLLGISRATLYKKLEKTGE